MYIEFSAIFTRVQVLEYALPPLLDDFERFDEKVKAHLKCSMLLRVLCCCTVKWEPRRQHVLQYIGTAWRKMCIFHRAATALSLWPRISILYKQHSVISPRLERKTGNLTFTDHLSLCVNHANRILHYTLTRLEERCQWFFLSQIKSIISDTELHRYLNNLFDFGCVFESAQYLNQIGPPNAFFPLF